MDNHKVDDMSSLIRAVIELQRMKHLMEKHNLRNEK